jgi:hypothetical protein
MPTAVTTFRDDIPSVVMFVRHLGGDKFLGPGCVLLNNANKAIRFPTRSVAQNYIDGHGLGFRPYGSIMCVVDDIYGDAFGLETVQEHILTVAAVKMSMIQELVIMYGHRESEPAGESFNA